MFVDGYAVAGVSVRKDVVCRGGEIKIKGIVFKEW